MVVAFLVALSRPLAVAAAPDPAGDGPAPPPNVEDLEWTPVRGLATDLAISANGIVFAVDRENHVWRWRGKETGWILLPRLFKQVAASPQGKPWAISPEGDVFRFNGLWWDGLGSAKAVDVAIGSNGEAFIVDAGGRLARWAEKDGKWKPFDGEGVGRIKRVAVDDAGQPWVIDTTGAVFRFERGQDDEPDRFVVLAGNAVDIAISPENAVFIATDEGTLARWTPEDSAWTTVPGTRDAVIVAVGPGAYPWVATKKGRIFGTADFEPEEDRKDREERIGLTPEEIEKRNARARRQAQIVVAQVTDPSPYEFTRVQAVAEDIAIGRDGSVFITDTESRVFRYSNADNQFLLFAGNLHRIAVAPDGVPWGINGAGLVFRFNGREFVQIPFIENGSEIAIGADGSVFVTDRDNRLLQFNATAGRFQDTGLESAKVAVTPAGRVWGIRPDGVVFRCDRDPCELVPNWRGRNIGIGPDDTVFLVTTRNELLHYIAARDEFERVRAQVDDVAVGPRGRPWIIDTDGRVFATTFFFQPLPTVFPPSDQQQQQPAAISFTKHLNFRSVKFDGGTAFELDIGRDGTVFLRHTLFPEVSRFKEAKNRFEREVPAPNPPDGCSPPLSPAAWSTFATAAVETDEIWQAGFIGPGVRRVVRRTPGASPKEALRQCETKFVGSVAVAALGCGSLSVGADGTVFAALDDCILRKYDPAADELAPVSPLVTSVRQVAVAPDGVPWIVDTSRRVRKFDGKEFRTVPEGRPAQEATRIAIGANGTVYVIDTKSRLRRYNATSASFDLISGARDLLDVAVTPDGLPWVIDSATNRVLRGSP